MSKQMRVAIQGFEGSFHQVAAEGLYGEQVQLVTCGSFVELIRVTEEGKEADAAVMAIENSIAGSILPNYHLLQDSGLYIHGEIYLPIVQNLMVRPGAKLQDLAEVHSHPMAIYQCRKFFKQFPQIRMVESEDTALSARWVAEQNSKSVGAIASRRAASLYGLEIIAPGIETVRNNFTRFLLLKNERYHENSKTLKATIYFETTHRPGSLAACLSLLAEREINLAKIQSFPVVDREWQYYFHLDLEFPALQHFHSAMQDLEGFTSGLRVLGIYKKGVTL